MNGPDITSNFIVYRNDADGSASNTVYEMMLTASTTIGVDVGPNRHYSVQADVPGLTLARFIDRINACNFIPGENVIGNLAYLAPRRDTGRLSWRQSQFKFPFDMGQLGPEPEKSILHLGFGNNANIFDYAAPQRTEDSVTYPKIQIGVFGRHPAFIKIFDFIAEASTAGENHPPSGLGQFVLDQLPYRNS